ncbi:MAG TPA: LemA family protein [Woeseiaceae bacterium]|nr:LemA family protein [Woeseiaceae bacterium]
MINVLLVALLGVAVLLAVLYNRLVRDRNRTSAAWSDIDVQLQRRHDLIPQLVKAVAQYASYERATMDAVTELRAAALKTSNVAELGRTEEELGRGVQRLLAIAEQYPDLKASENFLSLQKELVETEDYLQFARRYYNGSVRALNTRIETVPSNLVATLFHFELRDYFQKASDDAANVPLVKFASVE